MYCTKCGTQNPDDSVFCQKCGAPLATPPPPPVPPTSAAPVTARRTSGLAVASLVLGILGFFTGITSVLAIIFGGIAMGQIGKDPSLDGKGMAIAGLVMGIVVFAFGLLFLSLVIIGSISTFGVDSLSM